MARLAVLLEDWEHILVVGHRILPCVDGTHRDGGEDRDG